MDISWFPDMLLPTPGRLGLTHLPGGYTTSRDDELDALAADAVSHLVCLVEAHELQRMEPPETVAERADAVEKRGMAFLHHPIEDFNAPELEKTRETVLFLNNALKNGETVVVHCWAGLGRAGTLAACLLVHRGMSAKDAIQTVRWVRSGAIQSESQETLIALFAESQP